MQRGPVSLPLLPIAVDSFTSSPRRPYVHFLTHFHADHYVGLRDSFRDKLYCSHITRSFVLHKFPGIPAHHVVGLDLGTTHGIPLTPELSGRGTLSKSLSLDSDGSVSTRINVRLVPANHCAGAVMFLFEGYFGRYLHTGDFRWSPLVKAALDDIGVNGKHPIDCVFMDATFSAPYWEFPSQAESIRRILDLIRSHPPETDVYLECDMLGTEPIIAAISTAFGCKIHIDNEKYRILRLIPRYEGILTTAAHESRFHCVPQKTFTSRRAVSRTGTAGNLVPRKSGLSGPSDLEGVLCIKPSAQWFGMKARRSLRHKNTEAVQSGDAWHVLYSMHSSHQELCSFLSFLRPRSISYITECDDRAAVIFERMCSRADSTTCGAARVPLSIQRKFPWIRGPQGKMIAGNESDSGSTYVHLGSKRSRSDSEQVGAFCKRQKQEESERVLFQELLADIDRDVQRNIRASATHNRR